LGTCPQAAFISYHQIVAKHLKFDESEQLVCSISMGYEDQTVAENQLVTERVPVTEFVHFVTE
jgi:hypothetical protein